MPSIERAIAQAVQIRPTPRQLAWQEMETIAFMHFGMNTFTDREWGEGTEDPRQFDPTALDAHQWAEVCRDAGFRMIILTAKHHDGFCLWPSRFTEHCVRNSPWRNGKGDVVSEAAEACRAAGLKFGVYLSPWDRHEPAYGDSPRYNEHFRNQLRELLTQYGDIGEVWFDGACAEGPNGKRQRYDWASYHALIRELQPHAVIAICGPDCRWVGNESGVARPTEWSVVGVNFDGPPADFNEAFYNQCCNMAGNELADETHPGHAARLAQAWKSVWWPAETDVSVRPGWFYHPSEDLRVHSLEHLVDIYYKSVGRNTVLLMNIPPDRRGLIHENDAERLREWRRTLDHTFRTDLCMGRTATATSARDPAHGADKAVDGTPASFWAAADGATDAAVEVDLGKPARFNRLCLQEAISEGQRIAEYALEAWHDGAWKEVARGTTVGYKKLDRFGSVTASRVRVVIRGSRAAPTLRTLSLYEAMTGA